MAEKEFEGWAIVELMGHRRLGGYLSQATIAGSTFLRVDIPDLVGGTQDNPKTFAATQFYNPDAVYCLTPCSVEAAYAAATLSQPTPIQRWELPRLEDHEEGRQLADVISGDDQLPPF